MEYTREIQPSIDIDWFAIDSNGIIIHFASGGGLLPVSVSSYKEDTDMLSSYFRSLPLIDQSVQVNARLHEFVKLTNEDKERYLADFLSMSKRGVYSFDKSYPGDFLNRDYHLVSFPKQLLSIDVLPEEVKSIISRTQIDVDIRKVTLLSIDDKGEVIYET